MAEPAAVAEVREAYAACTELAKTTKASEYAFDPLRKRWIDPGMRDGGDVYEAVSLHAAADGKLLATLAETSQSGDWTLVTEYCFRAGGSLAFSFSTLRTFYGGVKAETRKYYEPSGKEVWSKRASFDLETGQPTKKDFMDRPAKVFLTVKKLRAELELP